MTAAIASSRDGRLLASSSAFGATANSQGVIKIWDAKTGNLLHTLSHASTKISFGSSGKILASGGHNDQEVRLWDVQSGALIGSLMVHRDQPLALAFGSDDQMLASAGQAREVILWDLTNKSRVRAWPPLRIWEWQINSVRKAQSGKGWKLSVELTVQNIGSYGRSFDPTAKILRGDGSPKKGVVQLAFSAPGIDRIVGELRSASTALAKPENNRAPLVQGRVRGELAAGVPVSVSITPVGTAGVWTYDAEVKFNARSAPATIVLNFSVGEDFDETGLRLRFLDDEKPLVAATPTK